MTEIYGHKWTTHYGPEPSQVWCAGLDDLTSDQIAQGFRWCVMQRADGWPPNLPEFRRACLLDERALPEAEAYRAGMSYASAMQYGRPVPDTPAEVIETCRRATSLALISTTTEQSKKLFGYHYAQVLVDVANGIQFQQQPVVQAITQDHEATPAEIEDGMRKMRAALNRSQRRNAIPV